MAAKRSGGSSHKGSDQGPGQPTDHHTVDRDQEETNVGAAADGEQQLELATPADTGAASAAPTDGTAVAAAEVNEPALKTKVLEVTRGGGQLFIDGQPRIEILAKAYERLFAYIDLYKEEISGFGRVTEVTPGVFRITEVFLVEQDTTSGAHVEITEGFAKFCAEEMAAGRELSDIHFWWHSHVNMESFWSDTDERTARSLDTGDWLIALVGNKKGEFRARFELYRPIRVAFDNLPLHVLVEVPDESGIRVEVGKDIRIFLPAPRDRAWRAEIGREIKRCVKGSRRYQPVPVYDHRASHRGGLVDRFVQGVGRFIHGDHDDDANGDLDGWAPMATSPPEDPPAKRGNVRRVPVEGPEQGPGVSSASTPEAPESAPAGEATGITPYGGDVVAEAASGGPDAGRDDRDGWGRGSRDPDTN